jgi:aspartate/methionine/tyrosine aminotransferase
MRKLGSDYLEWAKGQGSVPPFALTASGMPARALAELGLGPGDIELSGPAGYGHAPLLRGLAALHEVAPEQVVTSAGASMVNHLAMAALIEPGDEVLIERPTYEPLLALAHYLGARVTRFERTFEAQFRVEPQAIARALTPATRLIVITNLHNPSGVFTDARVLGEVGELARPIGARVLVDEAYLAAVSDAEARSACHLGPSFVTTNSLTKIYGLSGLRCGFILAAPELARRMWRLNDLFANHDVFPAQQLAARALAHLPTWRAEVRRHLDDNRRLVLDFIAGRRELAVVPPRHGTILFPRLLHGDVEALCTRLVARDGAVVPGRFFEAPSHFRIGLGMAPDILRGGLERLGAALDEVAR